MEENVDVNLLLENSIHGRRTNSRQDRIFQLQKMNMDSQQLELVVKVRELHRNHFKVECENGMITIKAITDYLKPRMATISYALPCEVHENSMEAKLQRDGLVIRCLRESSQNYLFDWQAMKRQDVQKN